MGTTRQEREPVHDPQHHSQSEEPECRWPRLNRVLRTIRHHAVELGVILAFFALFWQVFGPGIQFFFFSSDSDSEAPRGSRPLTFVAKVKRAGMPTWSESVELPAAGGSVEFGMRVENAGSQTLTGVVVRAAIPDGFEVSDRCRYGLSRIADTPCTGEIVAAAGEELPDLEPGQYAVLVFPAVVSPELAGGRYAPAMRVTSDQTGELEEASEVIVPATDAEDAVETLFSQTEGEEEFWGGTPEMAIESKRLLIELWPTFNFETAHSFAEVPDGRPATLGDLFYEPLLAGQISEVRGRVAARPRNLAEEGGVIKQSYEVMAEGEYARLRCYTPRPYGDLLEAGQELEIKIVPIAWSPGGNEEKLTMAMCPAARVVMR
jgi:Domain of unknown function DUF11